MDTKNKTMMQKGVVSKWRKYLPFSDDIKAIGLGEGNTPLIRAVNLTKKMGIDLDIYLKFEGLNPTGSFKDRGMAAAVTGAVARGAKILLCASTGNTSASAAAYAARSGLHSVVVIPNGKIAMGKLAQAVVFGAKVLQIEGNFDLGMERVKKISVEHDEIELVNSVNPLRLEGQKTAAYEITQEIGSPDYHVLPVGNAGNISAYWKGYTECQKHNLALKTPIMVGYQAEGAAPFMKGSKVDQPETIATAIRIGNPQSWDLANEACRMSQGWFNSVSDQQIIAAMSILARYEGVFCEPASASTIAGILKDYALNKFKPGSVVVCTITGNGLKDTKSIDLIESRNELISVSSDEHQLTKAILTTAK